MKLLTIGISFLFTIGAFAAGYGSSFESASNYDVSEDTIQDYKYDLQELEVSLKQLNATPELANDNRFQDKIEAVLQKYATDYNHLSNSEQQSTPINDLNLDLEQVGLVSINQQGYMSAPDVTGLADFLNDLVDKSHKVSWIEIILIPAIDTAISSIPPPSS